MSKKYTAKEMKAILKGCCDVGYSIIANVHREMAKLELTPEELLITDNSSERINVARKLRSIIAGVSETLMPAYEISLVLCAQENLPFITHIQEQHKQYIKTLQALPPTPPVITPEVKEECS
jgi:hypothetical protein